MCLSLRLTIMALRAAGGVFLLTVVFVETGSVDG